MNTKNATKSPTTKATKSPRHSVNGSLRAPTSAEIAAGRTIPVTVYLTEDDNEFLRGRSQAWRHTMAAHFNRLLALEAKREGIQTTEQAQLARFQLQVEQLKTGFLIGLLQDEQKRAFINWQNQELVGSYGHNDLGDFAALIREIEAVDAEG